MNSIINDVSIFCKYLSDERFYLNFLYYTRIRMEESHETKVFRPKHAKIAVTPGTIATTLQYALSEQSPWNVTSSYVRAVEDHSN